MKHSLDPLNDHEQLTLDTLARDVLRSAASAPDAPSALAWSEAASACLRALTANDLRAAGALFDRTPHAAPFADTWREVTAPIAARAEAAHLLDVERDVERQAERLARPETV